MHTGCQIGDIVLSSAVIDRNCTDCRAGLQLNLFRMIQNQRFDLCLGGIRQLIAGGGK